MRQIFTSPRLENVEGVAALLNEHGIETWISGSRSYRGSRRQVFSYREGAQQGEPPAVWIVRAEDQTRARALLREAGLIDSTRSDSYVPASLQAPASRPTGNAIAQRVRLVLLAAIAVGAFLTIARLI